MKRLRHFVKHKLFEAEVEEGEESHGDLAHDLKQRFKTTESLHKLICHHDPQTDKDSASHVALAQCLSEINDLLDSVLRVWDEWNTGRRNNWTRMSRRLHEEDERLEIQVFNLEPLVCKLSTIM